MRMNWTVWSRRFLTGLAMVGLVGFTFADKVNVDWNVPDDWTTKDKPAQAEQVDANGSTVELEQNTACQDTSRTPTANVAVVTNSSDTASSVYGVNDGGLDGVPAAEHGSTSELERDVWLKVSGGKFATVVGGSRNDWTSDKRATPLKGDIFLELSGTTTSVSGNLIGAVETGGLGKGVTGKVLVVVADGATVSGNVLGGSTSRHAKTPTITGDTKVRILSVLTGGNRVLGGSMFDRNVNSSAKHVGNTAVEVELVDDTSGTFAKEIVGGSYANTGSNDKSVYSISESTSVSITAPNTVTFSSPIYGASVAATPNTDASVGGNSSVTIEGGTYTSGIYAAGYGAAATVTSKATLTLKSGVFSGATLGVGNNGCTVGSSELVIAGTSSGALDLSGATLKTDFKAVSLQGDVTLGTTRLTSLPALSIDTTSPRTITFTLTNAEYALFSAELCAFSGTAVPENLKVVALYPESNTEVTGWSLKVEDGKLVYSCDSTTRTWSTPQSGTDWSAGLSGFVEGDNVTFGTNDAQETVTLPADGTRVKDLTVEGSYTFDLKDVPFYATSATIGENGAFATVEGFRVNALRWKPSGATWSSDNAVAELILTLNGSPVAWPLGTTIAQLASDGTTLTNPTWTNDEGVNALIDGVYGSSSATPAPINPQTGTSCTYTEPAGYLEVSCNKWRPQTAGVSAVITLGSAVAFDGYIIWAGDNVNRNPTAWTLEASTDGGNTWVTLDSRSGIASPGTNVEYNGGTPYAVTGVALAVTKALTVNGTLSSSCGITAGTATFGAKSVLAGAPTLGASTITFTEGSTIKVPASGVATLVGTVSGKTTIDLTDYLESNTPEEGATFPVLQAPEGLELTPPEGYMLGAYANGYYTIYKSTPTWTAGSDNNTWSNLDRWTGLAEEGKVPTSGTIFVNFGSGDATTLTIDTAVSDASLRVFGASGSAIEFGTGGSLSVATLTAQTDFTLPATATVTEASIATGKTLTLSGSCTLSTAFTSGGTLALVDGTVTLADSVSFSTLTAFVVGKGATLDFNGKSRQSDAFTLAGGTIKNSSTTTINVGPVTLTADSFVDTTGGVVQFNAANNSRKDLVLNNHTLTKTGSNRFDVVGADIDSGTIRIEAGVLKLSSSSGDCTLTGTTLSFAQGANYFQNSGVDHWIQASSGTVTLEADEGAEVSFSATFFKGAFALKKTGAGTVSVNAGTDWSQNCWWTGATTVSGGTLVFNQTNADITTGGVVTVSDGATFKKTGTNKLTFNAAPSGTGTIEVAAGTIKQAVVACGGFKGLYQIDSGATLDAVDNTNYHPFMSTSEGKGIVLNGTLKVSTGSCALTDCSITGTGSIEISKCGDHGSMTLTCPTSITGALKIAEGVTVSGIKDGKKLVLSGPDVVCNGTLSGADASITIEKGKMLSGTGEIAGAVTLSDGSTLNASTATDSSRLTLSGALTAGGAVSVVLPTSPATGLQLVKWEAAPTGATYTATPTLSALAFLHAKTDGLYYDVMSIDGGTAGSDTGSMDKLSDAVKHALAEAAFDKGATSIKSVTGTQGGADLSATAIDNALTCFALTPSVSKDEGGVATITIAYDFGISGMSAVMVENALKATVKAKVENGSAAAYLAEGAEIILQSKDKTAEETAWAEVEGATFEKEGDIYKATVSLSDVSNKVFRVLARTKATE